MDNTMWVVIAGVAGLLIGAALVYVLFVSNAQRRVRGYAWELDDKNRQLESMGHRLGGLETDLNNRQTELDDWRNRYQTIESRADEERVKAEGLGQTIERMQGQTRDYEEKLRTAESEMASVRNERAQQERELENLRERLEEEHGRVEALEARLKSVEKERSVLENRVKEAEAKRRSVLDTVKRTLTGESEEERVEAEVTRK